MLKPKNHDVLVIEPEHELRFEEAAHWNATIRMSNPSPDRRVNFKLKTTAPKNYLVRPNSGELQPGKSVEARIMLLNVEQLDEQVMSRHKFMVQFVQTDGKSFESDPNGFWASIPADDVLKYKLKCVFVPASGGGGDSKTTIATATAAAATKDSTDTSAPVERAAVESHRSHHEAAAPPPSLGGATADDARKIADLVRTLRDEEATLRREHAALKLELARMQQKRAEEQQRGGGGAVMGMGAATSLGDIPTYYIALAVALAVVAFLFGRML